jgi:molybdate-binding protein
MVHGVAGELPAAPVPVTRWHFARWRVGVAIAGELQIGSLEALLERAVPVVQRDPAAASQIAFERACAALGHRHGQAPRIASGHLDAARTASILGGAAVTTEAAAQAFGLRFVELEEHTVELWIDQGWAGLPAVGALGDLLSTSAFTQRVESFGGYDLSRCGDQM